MLKIRLQRIGRRNQPHFRLVVIDKSHGPKSGKFLEIVGSYNPKLGNIELNNERIKHWIDNGAQPSDTVHNFLVDAKIIDGKKINVLPQKSPVVDEEALAAEKEAEEKAKQEAEEAEKKESEDNAAEEEKPAEEAPEEKKEEPTEEKEESQDTEEEKEEESTDDNSKEESQEEKPE